MDIKTYLESMLKRIEEKIKTTEKRLEMVDSLRNDAIKLERVCEDPKQNATEREKHMTRTMRKLLTMNYNDVVCSEIDLDRIRMDIQAILFEMKKSS